MPWVDIVSLFPWQTSDSGSKPDYKSNIMCPLKQNSMQIIIIKTQHTFIYVFLLICIDKQKLK